MALSKVALPPSQDCGMGLRAIELAVAAAEDETTAWQCRHTIATHMLDPGEENDGTLHPCNAQELMPVGHHWINSSAKSLQLGF